MVGVAKAEDEGGAVQELAAPQAVALSPDGKTLAVADTGNHRWQPLPATALCRIRIYSANSGRPILSFGARGEGEAWGGQPVQGAASWRGRRGWRGTPGATSWCWTPPGCRWGRAGRPSPGVHRHRGVDQDRPGEREVQGAW